MARIPYADLCGSSSQPLVEKIVAERGKVLHLYQMLLHSPAIAEGWLNLMSAVRLRSTLPGAIRELVIVRIALLNRAPYEAEQHVPIALREGATQAQLDKLVDWTAHCDEYSAKTRAALELADRMTKDVQIDDASWASLAAAWTNQELVELVATIASYNMVSRFLEALQIHSTDRQ